MQVILLEKIGKLGKLGDVVNVAAGYGRNYLIPQRKAMSANRANLAVFAERRAELEAKQGDILAQAQIRAATFAGVTVRVSRQATDDGRLFGSVGTHDVVHALSEAGHSVEKSELRMPQGVFKMLGEHDVEIHLHGDVVVTVKVSVVPG